MNAATATGWAMNAVCEPVIVPVVAPMCLTMNACAFGWMTRSSSETRYQLGLVFQPAAVAFSVNAAALSGRWEAAKTAARSTGMSAQNASWKASALMNRSGPPTAPGASHGVGLTAAPRRGREGGLQTGRAFVLVEAEGGEVHQCSDIGQGGGGLGDHGAAVGVSQRKPTYITGYEKGPKKAPFKDDRVKDRR
jgi:hypothetical protein